MTETTKPQRGGWGLKSATAKVYNCQNPTTSTRIVQLFGTFDRDTMNAVIVTAREVSQHE